jgi:hypothetical protein
MSQAILMRTTFCARLRIIMRVKDRGSRDTAAFYPYSNS